MATGIYITRDYNGTEKQRSLEGPAIADGTDYDAADTLWSALVVAQDALSIGVPAEYSILNPLAVNSGTPATPLAQSNHEFIVYFHQTSDPTVKRTYRISCADLSAPTWFIGTTETLNPATTVVGDFITAFEAWATIDGNAVTVDQIVYEDD